MEGGGSPSHTRLLLLREDRPEQEGPFARTLLLWEQLGTRSSTFHLMLLPRVRFVLCMSGGQPGFEVFLCWEVSLRTFFIRESLCKNVCSKGSALCKGLSLLSTWPVYREAGGGCPEGPLAECSSR